MHEPCQKDKVIIVGCCDIYDNTKQDKTDRKPGRTDRFETVMCNIDHDPAVRNIT